MKYRVLVAVLMAGLLTACESPDKAGNAKAAVKVGQDTVTEAEIERAMASVNAAGADQT